MRFGKAFLTTPNGRAETFFSYFNQLKNEMMLVDNHIKNMYYEFKYIEKFTINRKYVSPSDTSRDSR